MALSKITNLSITDDAVRTVGIQDDNVTLAKLGDGTQGDILYYGASGAPARLGFGTSGDFLKTQGTGANPAWAAAGGAWTLIKTKTASADSEITFIDGTDSVVLDSTYKMYCVMAINVEVATNNSEAWVFTSNDGGSSWESTYDSLDVRGVNWSAVPATYVFTSAIAHVGSVGNAGGKAFNMTL